MSTFRLHSLDAFLFSITSNPRHPNSRVHWPLQVEVSWDFYTEPLPRPRPPCSRPEAARAVSPHPALSSSPGLSNITAKPALMQWPDPPFPPPGRLSFRFLLPALFPSRRRPSAALSSFPESSHPHGLRAPIRLPRSLVKRSSDHALSHKPLRFPISHRTKP